MRRAPIRQSPFLTPTLGVSFLDLVIDMPTTTGFSGVFTKLQPWTTTSTKPRSEAAVFVAKFRMEERMDDIMIPIRREYRPPISLDKPLMSWWISPSTISDTLSFQSVQPETVGLPLRIASVATNWELWRHIVSMVKNVLEVLLLPPPSHLNLVHPYPQLRLAEIGRLEMGYVSTVAVVLNGDTVVVLPNTVSMVKDVSEPSDVFVFRPLVVDWVVPYFSRRIESFILIRTDLSVQWTTTRKTLE